MNDMQSVIAIIGSLAVINIAVTRVAFGRLSERITGLENTMNARFAATEARLKRVEDRLDALSDRLLDLLLLRSGNERSEQS